MLNMFNAFFAAMTALFNGFGGFAKAFENLGTVSSVMSEDYLTEQQIESKKKKVTLDRELQALINQQP
jgi:hypothetical protein